MEPTEDEMVMYDQYLKELTEELSKPNPSTASLKRLMKLTFKGRRTWIQKDTPTVAEITDVFPQLKISSRVSVLVDVCTLRHSYTG